MICTGGFAIFELSCRCQNPYRGRGPCSWPAAHVVAVEFPAPAVAQRSTFNCHHTLAMIAALQTCLRHLDVGTKCRNSSPPCPNAGHAASSHTPPSATSPRHAFSCGGFSPVITWSKDLISRSDIGTLTKATWYDGKEEGFRLVSCWGRWDGAWVGKKMVLG